jgi:hypothetical protein
MTAWLGPRFEPWCLHHPVLGFGPSQVISHFARGNRGFLASGASLNVSLLGDEPAFAGLSLRGKFPFPAHGGDWFDGWLVGLEFEPTNSTPLLGLRPSSPEAGMEADSDRFRSGSCDFRASAIRDGRDGV